MASDQFTEWVQEAFNSCNIHNKLGVKKLIVGAMRKFHFLNKEEVQYVVKARPILR